MDAIKLPIDNIAIAAFVIGHDDDGRALARIIAGGSRFDLSSANVLASYGFQAIDGLTVSTEPWPLPTHQTTEWRSGRSKSLKIDPSDAIPLPALQPGDVIVSAEAQGYLDGKGAKTEKMTVRLAAIWTIGRADNIQQAVTLVRAHEERFATDNHDKITTGMTTPECLHVEAAAVRASRQRNEALLVVWKDEEGKDSRGHVLGHTGSWFFFQNSNDAFECGLDTSEPGIFYFSHGVSWSTGDGIWEDYDCGIDGDYEPATAAHLEMFGYTPESIINELDGVMSDDFVDIRDPVEILVSQGMERPSWHRPGGTEAGDDPAPAATAV